jgi:hypothetical protein
MSARAVERLLAELPAGDPERAALQARANRYAGECGCKAGSVAMALALVLTPAVIAVRGEFGLLTLVVGVGAVFAAAVAGKAAGLLLARVRLALLRVSLARRVERGRPGLVELH